MPFYNIMVKKTQKYFYLISAADQATAEKQAKDATNAKQQEPYDTSTAVKTSVIDPDAIP